MEAAYPDVTVADVGDYVKSYPTGVLVLDFLASVFLVCTARLGFRIYREELRPVSTEGLRRVLVVGAGNAAEAIIREIHRMPVERYRVIGLVDDDPAKQASDHPRRARAGHDRPTSGRSARTRRSRKSSSPCPRPRRSSSAA